jgi:hypothetical protein
MAIIAQEAAASMDKTVCIEEHPASSLYMDDRIQRAIRPGHLKSITQKLDLDAIGVIIVSRRPDGKLAVLDGQHRIRALVDSGMGDWNVTCKVFDGLTIREEAGLFRRYNTTSKTNALEDLVKAVVEGEPEAVAIDKIARRNGLKIGLQTGPGVIACAAAMRKIYRADKKMGPAALSFALHIGVQSWGAHSDSVDGHLVQGLGDLYLRYGEDIDRAALIRKLAKHKGGARGVIGQAKTLAGLLHVAVHRGVAQTVLGLYNKGRRDSGQLPPL